ncbi:zinc finger domain-containing protein [Streptomyces amritsarensis]|uniref:zinc finger domain-containing protein n=1 Tax=Streptomyces amritsarensis TaxID=681158 RepID=UPI0036931F9C
MDYFTLPAKASADDVAATEAALRRAWNACAAVRCSKCGAAAGQYCRNRTGGTLYVTRFHRPRQDAAGAPEILRPVGINGLSWARAKGAFVWDGRRVPQVREAGDGVPRSDESITLD